MKAFKMIAATIVVLMVLLSLLVPLFSPFDILKVDLDMSLRPPSLKNPMGTDMLGRDMFTRITYATRISLFVGLASSLLAFIIGIIMGGVAGYFGGFIDDFIMRLVDVFLSFPYILGALTVIAVFGTGVFNTILVIAMFTWALFARLHRSSVMEEKGKEYVKTARLFGFKKARIIFVHLLPNSVGPALAYLPLLIGSSIIAESSLSFLGLGIQKPFPSWGQMIADSSGLILTAPWLMIFPGIFLSLTVLSFVLFFESKGEKIGVFKSD